MIVSLHKYWTRITFTYHQQQIFLHFHPKNARQNHVLGIFKFSDLSKKSKIFAPAEVIQYYWRRSTKKKSRRIELPSFIIRSPRREFMTLVLCSRDLWCPIILDICGEKLFLVHVCVCVLEWSSFWEILNFITGTKWEVGACCLTPFLKKN